MFHKIFALTLVVCGALAATAATAFANAPNPTSVQVINEQPGPGGNGVTVTIAGTWTWDQAVPSGGQKDCNDSRIGVGYAVDWGDNAANKPLPGPNGAKIYPGDAQDDWVHSVSEGMGDGTDQATGGNLEEPGSSSNDGSNLIVDGPFNSKPGPGGPGGPGGGGTTLPETGGKVTESMTGMTADAVDNDFGANPFAPYTDSGEQGISDGSSDAVPTNSDAAKWYSNCGPTQPKGAVIGGQPILGANGQPAQEGNTDASSPQNGYPNGYWGPISHTYTGSGPYTICPVMYDPHGQSVGGPANDPKQITADANGDNSVQSNGNASACPITVTFKGQSSITTNAQPQSPTTTGQALSDTATISGKSSPGGSVTFNLYGPSDPGSCLSTPVYTDTVTSHTSVSSSISTFQSGTYAPSAPGTYRWTASYSGDSNNSPSSEGCNGGDESTTVNTPGQAAITAVKTEADSSQGEALGSGPITANPGDAISYQVQVTNTGNVALSNLTLSDTVHNQTFGDATCSNVEGPFTDPSDDTPLSGSLAPGHVAYFTCSYVVPAGTTGQITNTATVTGSPPSGPPVTSPPTTVTATPAAIKVTKLESDPAVSGESSPSAGPIIANPGDTIFYVVQATNTGDENLINPSFSDALTNQGFASTTCSNIAGPYTSPSGGAFSGALAPGQSVYYTCSYLVPSGTTGPVTNTGAVTATPANGGNNVSGQSTVQASPGCQSSQPGSTSCFTVLKEQEIIGSGGSFQTTPLSGNVGQIVEYQITATNIGNTALAFGTLNDPQCDAGTVTGGPGSGAVAPGKTTTWYCSHKLTTADQSNGSVTNVALVPAGPPGGTPRTEQSNPVITTVPTPPPAPPSSPVQTTSVKACTVTAANLKRVRIHNGTEFVISGAHITQVVFRLNGKVIKTLTKPNDKGKFMVKVSKARLKVGSNSVTATITEPCGPQVKAASLTRRPVIARKPVKAIGFTG
jgi:uncharacterized repeat protein (TIGR01451 family)